MQVRCDNGASPALPRVTVDQYLASSLDREINELDRLEEGGDIWVRQIFPENVKEIYVVYC